MDDADFFSKQITGEKGLTFKYDGTLVDFKKPRNFRELSENPRFDIASTTTVNKNSKVGTQPRVF